MNLQEFSEIVIIHPIHFLSLCKQNMDDFHTKFWGLVRFGVTIFVVDQFDADVSVPVIRIFARPTINTGRSTKNVTGSKGTVIYSSDNTKMFKSKYSYTKLYDS